MGPEWLEAAGDLMAEQQRLAIEEEVHHERERVREVAERAAAEEENPNTHGDVKMEEAGDQAWTTGTSSHRSKRRRERGQGGQVSVTADPEDDGASSGKWARTDRVTRRRGKYHIYGQYQLTPLNNSADGDRRAQGKKRGHTKHQA
jgi:hypothetical protein